MPSPRGLLIAGASALLLSSTTSTSTAAAADHSLEFWRSIAQHEYVPPAGSDVSALTEELEGFLASPNSELRDTIGYSTLAVWIFQKRLLDPEQLRVMISSLLGNLRQGIGERETDGVLRRSFSALVLSVIVARDNAAPFLHPDEVRRIEQAALGYLADERDVRGYDPDKGWMHSAAHTADLIKFVARSATLDAADQPRILDAIGGKLAAATVFTRGEDERFARAVLSIVNRPDFDRPGFERWLTRIRPSRLPSNAAPAALDAAQNVKNLLSKLEVLLSIDPNPSDAAVVARNAVRAAVKDLYEP